MYNFNSLTFNWFLKRFLHICANKNAGMALHVRISIHPLVFCLSACLFSSSIKLFWTGFRDGSPWFWVPRFYFYRNSSILPGRFDFCRHFRIFCLPTCFSDKNAVFFVSTVAFKSAKQKELSLTCVLQVTKVKVFNCTFLYNCMYANKNLFISVRLSLCKSTFFVHRRNLN